MSKKKSYRVRNWGHYNKALIKRGSLTLWFDEESIKEWHKVDKKKSPATLLSWRKSNKDFLSLYARAKEGQIEALVDEILKIADDIL